MQIKMPDGRITDLKPSGYDHLSDFAMDFSFTTHSPQQTIKFGRQFGSQLKGGEVIALCGPLGSGKTHLIKGIV